MHADAPPAKKKVSLGKGTSLLYRATMGAAEEGEDQSRKWSAEALLSSKTVGGLVGDLR